MLCLLYNKDMNFSLCC